LVRPSGYLDAELGLLLHYPTFRTTGKLQGSKIADPGNSCIRMLLKKGISPVTCLMIDRYCLRYQRKNETDNPSKSWPYMHRQAHERFSEDVMNDSIARVWIVLGKEGVQWYRDSHDHDIIFVPYGDDYSVEVALEYERDSPFTHRGPLRCTVVLYNHPRASRTEICNVEGTKVTHVSILQQLSELHKHLAHWRTLQYPKRAHFSYLLPSSLLIFSTHTFSQFLLRAPYFSSQKPSSTPHDHQNLLPRLLWLFDLSMHPPGTITIPSQTSRLGCMAHPARRSSSRTRRLQHYICKQASPGFTTSFTVSC